MDAGKMDALTACVYLVIIGTSIWVYLDAKKIGIKKSGEKAQTGKGALDMGPLGWAICCLLLWIVIFPFYLIKRPSLKKKFQSAATPDTPTPQPVALAKQPPVDFEQTLRKLAKLKEDGIISAEEFDQKKKALLGI